MIPWSGIGEVNSTSEDSGKFRFSLNLLRGFDADGGHLETKGLSPTGEVIRVPLHRHRVSLDFLRFQLDIMYRHAVDWDIALNLPYDIKNQDAFTDEIVPVTLEERGAILRNQNIHHRNEVYRSFADARLLVSHRFANLLRDDDLLVVSVGTSIPIGATETDPFKLGDAGQTHLHISLAPAHLIRWRRCTMKRCCLAHFQSTRLYMVGSHSTKTAKPIVGPWMSLKP